jgi:two-component system sensor histidine kinase BaeS
MGVVRPSGRPLAVRLALLLSGAVVLVLLVAGVVVNRVVSSSFEEQLNAQQQERLADVAALVGELNRPAARQVVGRLTAGVTGRVTLLDGAGRVVGSAGRLPPNAPTERHEQATNGSGPVQTVVLEVPQRGAQAFARVFNLALLISGALSVLVLMLAAGLLSDRLTRPLRGIASAARRLGSGDLSSRASGGADRESQELAAAFNLMAAQLERSESLRRRAASDMAHDLATPATVLESQLQAMVDGVIPADRAQLESARAAAAALSGVVTRMGELIAAESAALARRPEQIDLADLLDDARHALDRLFRDRSLRLSAEVAPGLLINGDRGQLARALRNVLTNAAQHSPADAEVHVAATRAGTSAQLRVRDQGAGISPVDLPHVFERFYRADASRRAAGGDGGSGIGLTIARELLTANGGGIEVERTGPDGTTFLMTLPLAASPTTVSATAMPYST